MNLYRVNYTYVAKNGSLRNAAIVVQAGLEEAAGELALAKLPPSQQWPRVTAVELYAPTIAPAIAESTAKKK